VQTLESPLGNEYLNATLLPTLPSPSDLPSSLGNNKRDSLPPLPSHNNVAELSVTPSPMAGMRSSSYGAPTTSSGQGVKNGRLPSELLRHMDDCSRYLVIFSFWLVRLRTRSFGNGGCVISIENGLIIRTTGIRRPLQYSKHPRKTLFGMHLH
jgi:hypothetical protein